MKLLFGVLLVASLSLASTTINHTGNNFLNSDPMFFFDFLEISQILFRMFWQATTARKRIMLFLSHIQLLQYWWRIPLPKQLYHLAQRDQAEIWWWLWWDLWQMFHHQLSRVELLLTYAVVHVFQNKLVEPLLSKLKCHGMLRSTHPQDISAVVPWLITDTC